MVILYVIGGVYFCVLKVIEGLIYRVVLGYGFFCVNGVVINF